MQLPLLIASGRQGFSPGLRTPNPSVEGASEPPSPIASLCCAELSALLRISISSNCSDSSTDQFQHLRFSKYNICIFHVNIFIKTTFGRSGTVPLKKETQKLLNINPPPVILPSNSQSFPQAFGGSSGHALFK